MDLREISEKQKSEYNKLVTHVMQSWEWGEFRKSLGTPILRYGLFEGEKLVKAFAISFHKIPFTKYFVGYLPKGPFPDKDLSEALKKIGKEQHCAFIKIEPDTPVIPSEVEGSQDLKGKSRDSSSMTQNDNIDSSFKKSPKPLFTKYNFVLDLTKFEEELLKKMHPKTRYNIRVAEKHGVKVEGRIDDKAFEIYLNLYFETTKRQGYHGHNEYYHRTVWETLKKDNMARILIASYKGEPLTAWMLFNFKDTLYYPYGGSSLKYKEVMSNNLVAWEAIKLGHKLGLKRFDMWGALGPDADPKDSWFGFHNFKKGYGGELVEYLGTFDLIFNQPLYHIFNSVDKTMPLKVALLKLLRHSHKK